MRLFLPMPGVTFHAPNGINSTKHLMILMAGPDGDKQVAVTSVTTDRNTRATDNSCILLPTDHRFIKHRSYVSYVHATFMTVDAISRGLDRGLLGLDSTLAPEVTSRVVQGALASNQTPLDVQAFVQANGSSWL
jgi:hypothetical protein